MTTLFNVVANKDSREEAYRFTKSIFQTYAKYTILAMYNSKNIIKCDGKVFNNYKKYNITMFKENPNYHVKEIKNK